jgi:hypothetical protein
VSGDRRDYAVMRGKEGKDMSLVCLTRLNIRREESRDLVPNIELNQRGGLTR